METTDVREIVTEAGQGLQVSLEPQLRALSDRYAARGLLKSVRDCAAQQMKREEETRALAPDAYCLSLLSEHTVHARYRRGKSEMSSSDLVRYFSETRAQRIQNADFSGDIGVDSCEEIAKGKETAPSESHRSVVLLEQVRTLSGNAGGKLLRAIPTWFNGARADTSRETRRFPLSAFAAVLVVAMSLMLIVASSVMLMRAENSIGRLKDEISAKVDEVAELKSDLDVKYDLLEIRRIAMEEYGMVDEDYLRVQHMNLKTEDSVEVYEDEREDGIGLSAILSALGIK